MRFLSALVPLRFVYRALPLVVLFLAICPAGRSGRAIAQAITVDPVLDRVVGNGISGYSGDGGRATDAEVGGIASIVFDSAGNLYVDDGGNSVIRKVDTSGIITTIAGNGTAGFSGDGGPATGAEMNSPQGIAVDSAGNLYISDSANNRIRKVAAGTNIITTVAGNGTPGYGGDGGPATGAEMNYPQGVAVDSAGNLYIADLENNRVRKVAAGTGIITTVAGDGTDGYTGDDGPATAAGVSPGAIAVDSAGNLYVSNYAYWDSLLVSIEYSVRKVSAATGIITTVAGSGSGYSLSGGDGGPATSAKFHDLGGVALDSAGNLYMSDSYAIREVNASTGIITTVAGNYARGFSTGTATGSELYPTGNVAFDSAGNMFIGELNGVRELNKAPYTLVFATSPVGPRFTQPTEGTTSPLIIPLRVNSSLTITSITMPLYLGTQPEHIVNSTGCRLNTALAAGTVCDVSVSFYPHFPGERPAPLVVATSAGEFRFGTQGLATGSQVALTPGTITTVVGNGTKGFSGDGGPATSAQLYAPGQMVLDSAGNLYFSDSGNHRVRKVTADTGDITTVANGQPMNSPTGLALDSAANLYIADQLGGVIRKVTAATGIVSTVAGDGAQGFSGDGGPATSAELNNPVGVAVDSMGNLYIADKDNYRIRKVAANTGIITTVAGNGTLGDTGDGGAATAAELYGPNSIALDDTGNLYFTETDATGSPASDVRKVTAGTGIITTVAGTGAPGYSGDGGPATSAELNGPSSIALDSAGDLYIADYGNGVIRKVDAGTGIIATVAGNGTLGSSGDGGPATSAEMVPLAVALDGPGNIYIANSYQSLPSISYDTIRKVDVSAGLLDFADTPVNSTSSDSPLTATISNIGNGVPDRNEELRFYIPQDGQNPSLSDRNDFNLSDGGSCQQEYAGSTTPFDMASGTSCKLLWSFTPTVPGNITGTVTLTDSSLNNGYDKGNGNSSTLPAVQVILLNGVGTGPGNGGGGNNPLADFTLTATPSSQTVNFGSTATYTVSVSGTNGFTGPVTLTAAGLPQGDTLSFNSGKVTLSGATPTTATLTAAMKQSQAELIYGDSPLSRGSSSIRYGLLLLPFPFLGVIRLRKRLRSLSLAITLIMLAVLSFGATASLTGCANIGLEGEPQSYAITVTGTSGSLQHSINVTLKVEDYVSVKY